MFSYYGSKSKIVKYYPAPAHDKIIEPFAGSARYSLLYWDTPRVLISDKFIKVVKVWEYLINSSEKDILGLPNVGYKEKIPDSLSDPEKWLIGYCIARGGKRPCTMGHRFNDWENDKKRIAKNLYKIRHWQIKHSDYKDLENEEATWFIDPPYQVKGITYSHYKTIDFNFLANWCKTRNGQVIVCENAGADWLDFKPMLKFTGMVNTNTEAIWTNFKTQYDSVQQGLFS
jgi:hypothetical protein